ncbi:carboxynorspermidine decarboxylase [Rubellicoccus peritrichatus]|uniref:Carboxynorspermidine/carboxyspermidine decarboxylase n=1 Tax=Rubellicoccus peritrichatus TaxID=3080537 RepID=A0AAQ3L8A7_9BACT|nr:carboxynorspermidine decarboxylase [Puniceicoccus sp. CR14]WOO40941.1 carboxynorspermidine decarboxylase [Puniceicoccus sp. CR14]
MSQDPTPDFTPQRLKALEEIPVDALPSPCYVIHLGCLEDNGKLLASIKECTGARILLAQKGFACWATYPILSKYLDGTTASGVHEALLGLEKFDGEVHVYSPAFTETDIEKLSHFAHTVVFNTIDQFTRFGPVLDTKVERGLRVNPEHSTVDTELYDPAASGSRLGSTLEALERFEKEADHPIEIDGLHFHTLCEQDSDALEETALIFEEKFQPWLKRVKWLNFGGGHHITRPGYDIDRLCRVIDHFKRKYNVDVYLEPGEAVALHTGILSVTVLDIMQAGEIKNVIVDSSATCHMPDVLEMPYRPRISGAGDAGEFANTYRLGGMSCLAGDIIGDYSFKEPLTIGSKLRLLDMSHYTMVKNTTFNGVPLPAIALYDPKTKNTNLIRKFGYADYRDRLS